MRDGLALRLAISLFAAGVPMHNADELAQLCKHDYYDNVRSSIELLDGGSVYHDIDMNVTHQYHYENRNVTPMGRRDQIRTLIINLEPCKGVVYLFVRKTRRCHPNPYSCIELKPGYEARNPTQCTWTHFKSEIDGSRDGAPTLFEVPLSSTNWYIAVFATEKSSYTLNVIGDTKYITPGAFPRPGNLGRIYASQTRELQVDLQWDEATYSPVGAATKYYIVYSALLLEHDNRTNMAVFLDPSKIMNTVCGLRNNTDRYYQRLPPTICQNGKCNATVDGVITDKRYVFNIVAQSEYDQHMAYSGLIMKTDWEVVRQAASDKTLRVVGVVSGSVLAMVVIVYVLMLKLYGG
jgi:hypothetical protein